ncbi:ankyrin repeat protein [Histoplasma capsulatum var. duboisii H88]|uniref:Ankyrin repeat protein n=1 Tax=Ajellomyces capsulatus (strain H88) TaxID=544711 RepID=F0UAR9_AJEC8|nr:ankyrin repeat protein [Histoplasma capsulatum var. duboisii H88]
MDPDYKTKYAIHEAAREGQTSVVESLLNANPKLAFLKDPDDRFPIHWAVAYNRFPIVELLVEMPKFDPDEVDASGWTPLMIAASLKDSEGDPIIELLLRKDADVNMQSVNGQNALHFATSKANVSTVRLLLAHNCSARLKDNRGQLALHRAAAVGSVPIINMLLQEGKSPLNATDVDGSTALHHAIAEGNGEAALVLLRAGAEVDKRDNNDKLAIELAPDSKVRFLLSSIGKDAWAC